jgi:hypothetical protein
MGHASRLSGIRYCEQEIFDLNFCHTLVADSGRVFAQIRLKTWVMQHGQLFFYDPEGMVVEVHQAISSKTM